jgi:hypothetical protein
MIVRQRRVIFCKDRLRGAILPRSENPDLHPTDEDLSAGTLDLGHPAPSVQLDSYSTFLIDTRL